ncbi:hypothetical protein G6675_00060 [Polynucleobacter paneuropaeus]|nr:hypothetical protein [Polynucleobacter paneuropaeus]MBT8599348.1 hypothetical protein [Polynucleobacter paneuropaeus]
MKQAKIKLYFEAPKQGEMLEIVESCALNYELSMEMAAIRVYEHLVGSLATKDHNDRSYFDRLFAECYRKDVVAPIVLFEVAKSEGLSSPSIAFGDEYVIDGRSKRGLWIEDSTINYFGESFAREFDVEYLGFERARRSKLSTCEFLIDKNSSNEVIVAEDWDTIYLLGNKHHIYDGEQFLEVKLKERRCLKNY